MRNTLCCSEPLSSTLGQRKSFTYPTSNDVAFLWGRGYLISVDLWVHGLCPLRWCWHRRLQEPLSFRLVLEHLFDHGNQLGLLTLGQIFIDIFHVCIFL